jgi:hypothetical protein
MLMSMAAKGQHFDRDGKLVPDRSILVITAMKNIDVLNGGRQV